MAAEHFITDVRPVFVTPSSARVGLGASRQFSAGGGTGPYTFDLAQSNTGGSVSPSGLWTAGTLFGTDKVRVTDAAGAEAIADGECIDGASLSSLRDQARWRADMVHDGNIEEGELTSYVNASAAELYDLLVGSYDDTYFLAPPYFVTSDGASDQFPYPTDFYKLRGVDVRLGSAPEAYVGLRRATFQARNDFRSPFSGQPAYGTTAYSYTDMGSRFRVQPRPNSAQVFRVWYVPRLARLVNDTDVLDGVSGWEEYVVVDCAIKMLLKQESDASGFAMQKAALKQRIQQMAAHRDIGSPPVAGDTCYNEYYGYAPGHGRSGF